MHEWRQIVHEKLAKVAMSQSRRENLIAELAYHLEDLHAELLRSGVTDPEAAGRCLDQLNDVQQITAALKRSQIWEDAMNQRSRTIWLPGLITLILSSALLMAMQLFTFSRPRVHWIDGGAVAIGFIWLFSFLPCGAFGAYLSARAGGSRWNSIIASLFPSLVMLGVWTCVILPIGIFVERNAYIIYHPRYFGLALLVWVVVPGAVSLLGALPVLWKMPFESHGPTDVARSIAQG